MRLKTNLVISVLFVALLAFVYFHEIKGGEQRRSEAERTKKLLDFSEHEAVRLTVGRRDTTVVLEKADGAWRVVSPLATGADQSAVDRYLKNLRETEVEGDPLRDSAAVAAEPQVSAQYGLDRPRLRVVLELAGEAGTVPDTLRFGDDTPTDRYTYAQRGGNPEVLRVRAWRFDNFDKGLFDLRDRRLLAFEPDDVRGLRLARAGESAIELEREGGHWRLTSPLARPADDGAVDGILSRVRNAEASEIIHEHPSDQDLAGCGLKGGEALVDATFWLGEDRAEKHLQVGREQAKGDHFARDTSHPQVFVIDSTVVRQLLQPVSELRDKHPFRVQAEQVDRVELRRGDQTVFSAQRDTAGEWSLLEAEGLQPKGWRLNSLITDLNSLEAKAFVVDSSSMSGLALGPYGLDAPRFAILVTQRGQPELELRVGAESAGDVFVMRADQPSVMRASSDDVRRLDLTAEDVASSEPVAEGGATDAAQEAKE